MKRLFIYGVLFSFAISSVWAEENEVNGEPDKTNAIEVKTTDISSNTAEQTEIFLKVYSMNNVLFIETNSEETIYIFTENGKLKKELTPTGGLIAVPMSRGTYVVKVGDLSRQVVVR